MRRRGNEKTQEISGHRIIVFGGQFANPADRGLFLAQAKFWFGPSVAPIAIGADRAPKRVTKLSRNRLGKIVGMSRPNQETAEISAYLWFREATSINEQNGRPYPLLS